MRILLQDAKTGLYFERSDVWTHKAREAFDFGTSQGAMEFAQAHRLLGTQIVAVFVSAGCIETISFGVDPMACEARLPRASGGVNTHSWRCSFRDGIVVVRWSV